MKTSSIWDSKLLRGLLAAAFWAAVWALAAKLVGLQLLLPGPAAAAAAFWRGVRTAAFWQAVCLSLCRVLGGFLAGTILGCLCAVLTVNSRLADLLLSPAIGVMRAVPVASFIILALLWIGSDLLPLFIAAIMVLPVVWKNVCEGIRQTDAQLLEMARVYRFGRCKTFRLIRLPSVRPYLQSACVTALGLAWKAAVAAEVLSQPKAAIGTAIYRSKIYLETPDLFAWTLTVIALSFLLEKGLARLFRRL